MAIQLREATQFDQSWRRAEPFNPRFILLWNDEHHPYRNARRVADGLEEAIRGVHDFLDGEAVWDEEKADEEV